MTTEKWLGYSGVLMGMEKMAEIFTRLACLIPRPHYSDIDQEGLGKRRTGTRQTFGVELKKRPNF